MSIAGQVALAIDGCDLGAQRRSNVRLGANLIDQILRHALFERVGAHDQGHVSRMVGEKHRSLAGRISGADEMHVEPLRDARFAARRAIEDPLAEQAVEAVRIQAAPAHAGRDDDGARLQNLVVVEDDAAAVRIEADDLARDENLRAQALGLPKRPARELRARDAARKAQIVLDSRRRLRLASRRLLLDHDRAQALRGSVHRRGEARRPAANDDGIVFLKARRGLKAEPGREFPRLRLDQRRPVGEPKRRGNRSPPAAFPASGRRDWNRPASAS